MSKNSAAHQKKVEHAVRKILKAPGLSIPDAMVLANFLKKDVANKTVCRAVHQAVKLRQDQALLGLCAPPPTDGIVIIEDPSSSLSDHFYLTPASPTRLWYRRKRTNVLVHFSRLSEQTNNSSLTSEFTKMRQGLNRHGL